MKLLSKNKDSVPTAAEGAPVTAKTKSKRGRKIVIAAVALLVVAGLVFALLPRNSGAGGGGTGRGSAGSMDYTYATVERRDITATLTDSGALEPADSYTVISLVSGEILYSDFETGDTVSKDDVLYQVDSSDASTNIERAENTLEQRQRSYDKVIQSREDLTVTAPISGTISGFQTQVGTKVNNGATIATLEDTGTLLLTEYYSDEYAHLVYPGMSATVSISDQMLTLTGSVSQVHALRRISPTGVSCFAVTVQVTNPGSLTVGGEATCWLESTEGQLFPTITDSDGFGPNDRKIITAGVSGTVEKVHVRNGEIIGAGEVLIEMSSDTLDDEITSAADNLRDARLSLDNQYDNLANYTIEAPIDGTIVDKYYKQGENTEMGSTLCTIFDLSCLTVTLYIDELDIRSVSVGQKAQVTCDSVPNTVYEGVITEVSINGTASGGVTTYPVKVQIDQTDGLLPGMNVDVAIVISERTGVITIPASAVQTGSRVLAKTDDGSTGEGAPKGYEYVRVEIGTSDEDFVEIVSGLEDGDEIAWIPDAPTTGSMNMMMGPMGMGMGTMPGGQMMGGGIRPSGQMGGTRPGGQKGSR